MQSATLSGLTSGTFHSLSVQDASGTFVDVASSLGGASPPFALNDVTGLGEALQDKADENEKDDEENGHVPAPSVSEGVDESEVEGSEGSQQGETQQQRAIEALGGLSPHSSDRLH